MLEVVKRFNLKRKIYKLENYAQDHRMWGNKLSTLIVLNQVVEDHYSLFQQKLFISNANAKVFHSSFNNIDSLVEWLRGVKVLLMDFANGDIREIPVDKQHLNITEQADVSLAEFIRDNNGYVVDLNHRIKIIFKLMREISGTYEGLGTKRGYLDMRLTNGINTALVFTELLLEVMINGK